MTKLPSAFLTFFLAPCLLGQPLKPFPLSQVRLGEGIFKASMEVNRRVLDEIGAGRAL